MTYRIILLSAWSSKICFLMLEIVIRITFFPRKQKNVLIVYVGATSVNHFGFRLPKSWQACQPLGCTATNKIGTGK